EDDRALDQRQEHRRHRDPARPGLGPGHRAAAGTGRAGRGRRRGRRGPGRDRRVRRVVAGLAERPDQGAVRLPGAGQRPHRRAVRAGVGRARQGAVRRPGRGAARAGGGGVRLRAAVVPQGRLLRPGLRRHRRVLLPGAVGRRRRDHPVQLPDHGADVDAPGRDRLRERLRAQAERAGPVGVDPGGRAVGRGRAAGRRVQRRARGQGRGRRDPGPPGDRGGVVRRLHPDRPVHPPAGRCGRQAGAGPGRREEPRDRAAGRRPGLRLRPPGRLGVRVGRGALHGDLGHRRGRRRRRPAGRGGQREGPQGAGRPGPGRRERDGPGDHRGRPGPDRRLHRLRRAGRCPARRGRPRPAGRRRGGGLLRRPDRAGRGDAGDGRLPRRGLRPRPGGAPRRHRRRGDRPGQRQPVRQRHGGVHQLRRGGPPVRPRRAGRHGGGERPDPGADGVLLLRRLEGLPLRRQAHARPGGRVVLHPCQGRHRTVAARRAGHRRQLPLPDRHL
ncbi:MAG: Malonate-semialdehyde dehydrogenase [inositol], partial [uncultured Corynebacteriales bacterium]